MQNLHLLQIEALPFKILRTGIPYKCLGFMWKLVQNALPVKTELHKRKFISSAYCVFCGENQETVSHLYLYFSLVQLLEQCGLLMLVASRVIYCKI